MASQKLNIDIVARDKSKQALGNLQKSLGRLKQGIFNLRNAFIGLGAGLVIKNLVNTGRELENLQVRLRFLLKNANEGAKAFDNMVKFASRVPFSLEEIQTGSGILATVTDNANDLQKMLEITGNVAAVTGLDFRTTAEQIQRSFSAGIGAADLFREKGVRNMLGFQAGATVSIEQTVEAFERVFGKDGRFGKATDDLADTFAGTISMIGDKIFSFKKTILEAGFFEGLKTQFGELDKFLEDNAKNIDRLGKQIGVVLAASVTNLAKAIKFAKDNFDLFVTAIKALIALKIVLFFTNVAVALMNVAKATMAIAIGTSAIKKGFLGVIAMLGTGGAFFLAFKGIDELFDGFLEDINQMAKELDKTKHPLGSIHEGVNLIKEEFVNTNLVLEEFEHELSVAVPSALSKVKSRFEELNDTALENLRMKFVNIKETIAQGLNEGISSFSNALARAIILGEDLGKSFKKMVQDALVNTLAVLIEILIRMGLQKLLGIDLENSDKRRLGTEKAITKEKAKQLALQLAILAAGGGSGGGGSFFGFFNKGGSVPKNKPIVVGERGPELFIPNSTGQITQSARGVGGGSVNVNFNINTVDATGFDELLARSRGTITQLINSAVNERGREALI